MNREQKRKQIKMIQQKFGVSREEAEAILIRWLTPKIHLLEGTKVKLNYKEISGHPDWKKMNPEYIQFVEDNKNSVLTVEYDTLRKFKNSEDKDTFVCLREDTTEPKWMFYTSDLIIQDEQPELKLKELGNKE